jgi:hypothetical protein
MRRMVLVIALLVVLVLTGAGCRKQKSDGDSGGYLGRPHHTTAAAAPR